MKVYIAAPFFNESQLTTVKEVESALSTVGIDYFSPRIGGILQDMEKEEQHKKFERIYLENISAMESCSHMVACIDDRDTGTIFEIGYFAKSGKPFTLFVSDPSKVSVMLAVPALSVCDSFEKIVPSLHGDYTATVEEFE